MRVFPTVTHAVHETFFRVCRRRLATRGVTSMVVESEQAAGQSDRDGKPRKSRSWPYRTIAPVPTVVTVRLKSWQGTGRLTAGGPRRSIGTA
jgi:hypothetical protein